MIQMNLCYNNWRTKKEEEHNDKFLFNKIERIHSRIQIS